MVELAAKLFSMNAQVAACPDTHISWSRCLTFCPSVQCCDPALIALLLPLPVSPTTTTTCSDLTDAEFCLFLEAEERRVNHCQVVLDLLLQAQTAHLKEQQPQQQQPQLAPPGAPAARAGSRGAADRVSARLAYLIAEQQVETHNLTAARKLLLQVVYTYRR